MENLSKRKCEACSKTAPLATHEEIGDYLPEIPEWTINESSCVPFLTRTFKFSNFVEALEFTNKVGAIAEEEGHHPAILTEWGKVTVNWWTHKIKGLHTNDFVMAAKTDRLL